MDITMCKDENCPVKEYCYRHTATPTEYWQSYFTESPAIYEEGKFVTCDMYWGKDQQSVLDLLIEIANGDRTRP